MVRNIWFIGIYPETKDMGINIREALIEQKNICHKLSLYEYINSVWEVVK
jgi:hypothetical protein